MNFFLFFTQINLPALKLSSGAETSQDLSMYTKFRRLNIVKQSPSIYNQQNICTLVQTKSLKLQAGKSKQSASNSKLQQLRIKTDMDTCIQYNAIY